MAVAASWLWHVICFIFLVCLIILGLAAILRILMFLVGFRMNEEEKKPRRTKKSIQEQLTELQNQK